MAQVTVQAVHCDIPREFTVELTGHNQEEHQTAIIKEWLRLSRIDMEEPLEPDEEEEEFSVELDVAFQNQFFFSAEPYRGEGAYFLYTPPPA